MRHLDIENRQVRRVAQYFLLGLQPVTGGRHFVTAIAQKRADQFPGMDVIFRYENSLRHLSLLLGHRRRFYRTACYRTVQEESGNWGLCDDAFRADNVQERDGLFEHFAVWRLLELVDSRQNLRLLRGPDRIIRPVERGETGIVGIGELP